MKRLDEVEARIIVNATNTPASGFYTYGITAAQYPGGGSFYLTGNLVIPNNGGIVITASNVTLDLNGFTITSSSASVSGNGINVPNGTAVNNLCIRNGHVVGQSTATGNGYPGGGFDTGVFVGNNTLNTRLEALNIARVKSNGIYATGANTVMVSCTADLAGAAGLSLAGGTCRDCSATHCHDNAIQCPGGTVENCTGFSDANTGIYANAVTNSYGLGLTGIYGYTVTGSVGYKTTTATTSYSIDSPGTVSQCTALAAGTGASLRANIAIGCSVQGNGSVVASYKYNMP